MPHPKLTEFERTIIVEAMGDRNVIAAVSES
jgi:hypothetical protein